MKFVGTDEFSRRLRQRVEQFFIDTKRRKRDHPLMYIKSATIMLWLIGSYTTLLFVVTSWWSVGLVAISMALAVAAIGFNIQHDASHKAYSRRPWVNKLMALTMDLVGGSSFLWASKHNAFHHTYTNIAGHDDDISVGVLGRLSPEQSHYWFHRMQAFYMWFLYGFITLKWNLFDDFYQVATGRIGPHKIRRPRGLDLAIFIGGKVVFFSFALVIPMLFHPWWAVLLTYVFTSMVTGVVLSVVFQLAHCVEEAEFPVPVLREDGTAVIENDWVMHQLSTTVNFSRRNPILCWFLGGLNFQVEHHLFHNICHLHYPALSKVVEEVCHECGVRYRAQKSFFSALASHFKFLVEMGKVPART